MPSCVYFPGWLSQATKGWTLGRPSFGESDVTTSPSLRRTGDKTWKVPAKEGLHELLFHLSPSLRPASSDSPSYKGLSSLSNPAFGGSETFNVSVPGGTVHSFSLSRTGSLRYTLPPTGWKTSEGQGWEAQTYNCCCLAKPLGGAETVHTKENSSHWSVIQFLPCY